LDTKNGGNAGPGGPGATVRGGTGEPVTTTLDGAVDLARDRELVERCQSGDEGAFAELYDRYHRRLLRFCLRRLHAHDDAEEAVQEAFTRAWRALPKFGGDRRFYPWLTVIAGNVCTDVLRRRARVVPMDELPGQAVELDGEEIDAQLLRQVDLTMATEAFTHLSDRHQRVLRLRESTEWSAQRIAELEGVAVPAVDTLLWRARQAFKREFANLSDAGGLAGILGLGLASLRRSAERAWLRTSAHLPAPLRGPGILAAAVALTGAAIAGGSVAIVGAGRAPHAVAGLATSVASTRAGAATARDAAESPASAASAGAQRSSGAARTDQGSRTAAGHITRTGPSGGAASGLSALVGGVASGTPRVPGQSATGLVSLFSNVGGLGLVGLGASPPASGGGLPLTAAGTVGGVVTGVSGAVASVAGSGSATSVAGTSATSVADTSGTGAHGGAPGTTPALTTAGTVVQTVAAPTPGGSSGTGSLLGGLGL